MDDQRIQDDGMELEQRNVAAEGQTPAEENEQDIVKKRRTASHRRRRAKKGATFLHFLQHAALVTAAVLIVTVLAGSYFVLYTNKGVERYSLIGEDRSAPFEDSRLFNQLLGNNISDIICYGAIRGQMETDGAFDSQKEIDITAFAGRYGELPGEYITARYYLDDLLKWAQTGLEYEEVYMSGEEVNQFLSSGRTVTKIDPEQYGSGIKYLTSDLTGAAQVVDVSGNLLNPGEIDRDDVHERILKNRFYTVDGKGIEDYVCSWEEYHTLCANLEATVQALQINYDNYLNYKDYFDSGDSNIVYYISKTIGDKTEIYTNMEQGKAAEQLMAELEKRCDKYIFYDASRMQFETNTMIEEATLRYLFNGYEYAYPEKSQVMIGVDSDYTAGDCFTLARESFGGFVPYLWQYLTGAVACIFIYLLLLTVLTGKEGQVRRRDTGEPLIALHSEDRIPTELMALAAVCLLWGLFLGISRAVNSLWQSVESGFLIVLAGTAALLVSLIFSFFYYSFVRRIKAGILWQESLIRHIGLSAKKWIRYFFGHSTLIMRVWVPLGIFVLLNAALVLFTAYLVIDHFETGLWLLGFLLLAAWNGGVGYVMYRSSLAREEILEGIRLIREGNLTHKVKEEKMYGEDLALAQAVNSIGESVRSAVETSMKDERLKADLITNVSHDIKTPLTSIINYVDLIKRENVSDPRIREYIEVLDVKSQRLKQLTDDLVEASKISSGNIVLQWEKINLVELLNQTIGEFSEKFEEKALYPMLRAPKGSVFIEADSRRIWRVIENLFNNIFKYALPGTRVYIDLGVFEEEKGQRLVMLSIKNISAQPLKVSPEELTERFIRGDESRTTEGSGLGLSIAKNLTEVQKGTFEIVMDGDLFKVNLCFPLLDEKQTI